MARVHVRSDVTLDEPFLVEGLPGVGLVGKIATDHIVDEFDMTYFASVDAEGLPQVGVYDEDSREALPPVRLYADEERDLLALQSDVPVDREAAPGFADALTNWLSDAGATPLYLSGLPAPDLDVGEVPPVFGVATGDAAALLDEHDVGLPSEQGVVGGPTGALVNRAAELNLDAVGLVVESDPQFPDPAASKRLIDEGIEPLTGITVDTTALVDHAEEIREQKERLAQQMQQAEETESSQAKPLRMFE